MCPHYHSVPPPTRIPPSVRPSVSVLFPAFSMGLRGVVVNMTDHDARKGSSRFECLGAAIGPRSYTGVHPPPRAGVCLCVYVYIHGSKGMIQCIYKGERRGNTRV